MPCLHSDRHYLFTRYCRQAHCLIRTSLFQIKSNAAHLLVAGIRRRATNFQKLLVTKNVNILPKMEHWQSIIQKPTVRGVTIEEQNNLINKKMNTTILNVSCYTFQSPSSQQFVAGMRRMWDFVQSQFHNIFQKNGVTICQLHMSRSLQIRWIA